MDTRLHPFNKALALVYFNIKLYTVEHMVANDHVLVRVNTVTGHLHLSLLHSWQEFMHLFANYCQSAQFADVLQQH